MKKHTLGAGAGIALKLSGLAASAAVAGSVDLSTYQRIGTYGPAYVGNGRSCWAKSATAS